MSHRIVIGLFSLLLVCGLSTTAFAQGKPHVKHPLKVKVKKVLKKLRHHHHHRGR